MSDANFTDTVTTESLHTGVSLQEEFASPREKAINSIRNSLRSGQQQMVDWQGGPLAVSAVPGAGKSTGMAAAAAIAIARQYQRSDRSRPNIRRQLVVVTFTRSAAANIKAKIRKYLRDDLSLPQTGFVVHTLHGLALNIASRHPNLSGLELDRLTLITPNQGHRLIRTSVEQWVNQNQSQYYRLIEGMQFDGEETERLRRQSVIRTEVLPDLASTVIHEAKSSGLSPEDLQILSRQTQDDYGILSIASGLYEQYETLMRDRDFIDYDDMILAALRVLNNPSARRIEQNQVFAVFEDEAQDSSPLQTQLLQILASEGERGAGCEVQGTGYKVRGAGYEVQDGKTGSTEEREEEQGAWEKPLTISTPHNPDSALRTPPHHALPHTTHPPHPSPRTLINLVRVGDPNQAINSTFTPADPIYFREFCQDCQAKNRLATMDRAGRSTSIVIEAANFALQWVNSLYSSQNKKAKQQHLQAESLATAKLPFRDQNIHLVEPGDPQPNANPPAIGQGLELHTPRDIHHTVELISQRIVELFNSEDANEVSGAILVRENRQGRWIGEALKPICKEHGINLYDVGEQDRHSHVPEEILAILNFCDRPHSPDYLKAALGVMVQRRIIETQDLNALASLPEDFLYPGPLAPPQTEAVQKAAHICRSLLRARLELPVYHLISFIGLTLDYEQAELATADKLAERIAIQIADNLSLAEMLQVLSEIVSSERFEPVDTEDSEARYTRPGQLTIITMHKAKGLDWDYVFMPFLHENLIPGRFWVPPQRQFLGSFTLSEVARAQIRAALHDEPRLPNVTEAWEQAKYLKIAEEYRLLYVAMTRAKRLLWMSAAKEAPFTWSKPDNLQKQAACPVFPALTREFGEFVVN